MRNYYYLEIQSDNEHYYCLDASVKNLDEIMLVVNPAKSTADDDDFHDK